MLFQTDITSFYSKPFDMKSWLNIMKNLSTKAGTSMMEVKYDDCLSNTLKYTNVPQKLTEILNTSTDPNLTY